MSNALKIIVLFPVFAGTFFPMEGCKNGPPPVMLVRHLLKHDKEQDLGAIAQGSMLHLEKSAEGTATVGEDFKVSLKSKSGDGHGWQCRTPNDPHLLVDAVFETEPAGVVAAGDDLQTIYHLHARAAGKAKIKFALVSTTQPNNAPTETITLEVEVKEASSK
ncbi:MAG: hypothetical protein DWI10_10490 [Planctomycetota bacterium]|nr:MAG: hypothetical protein DWI10_10490 [Planctomycetota bacterium]